MALAAEILLRLLLLAVAIYLLPRVFTGDTRNFFSQSKHFSLIDPARMPYRFAPHGQHSYEFPPLTIPFLVLGRVSFGSLTTFTWLFGTVMAGFELGSLAVLRAAWPEWRRSLNWIWYASVVPLALLGWFRHDFVAVFFATVAIVGLTGRRHRGRWVIAATVAGFAAKLWPVVLIPCLVVARRRRQAAFAAIGCAAVTIAWRQFSPKGFAKFLEYRKGSGLEVESLPASLRLLGHHGKFKVSSGAWVIDAGHFGWVGTALTVALVAFALFAFLLAWRASHPDVVALAGALTVASFLLSRIISPQYLVWAAPFVAILVARGNRLVAALAIASTWCTVGYLLFFDDALVKGNHLVGAAVLIRNLLLVALLAALTSAIRSPTEASPSPVGSAPKRRRSRAVGGAGGGAQPGQAPPPETAAPPPPWPCR